MPKRICVIDLPGLDRLLLDSIPTNSSLGKWLVGKQICGLTPSFPAVTCSVQATLTTGQPPARHGIVANGIATYRSPADQALVDASSFADYRRNVSFWEQSNQFLDCPRFWQDSTGKSRWKTAILFMQNSMPGFAGDLRPAADIVLTPKPEHGPDGKITSLCWSQPADLVKRLFSQLGPFPLMNYWGPMAGLPSSQWIASAAASVWREYQPQLQWVYVPHLDYDFQRFGPESAQARKAVADVSGALDKLIDSVLNDNGQIVLLSEYAMRPVSSSVAPNQLFAQHGLLTTRESADGAILDYEKSSAFAMVDHQVAHVYARDAATAKSARKVLEDAGAGSILSPIPHALRHRRAGDFVIVANPDSWFDYRWWTDPGKAPKFAGMVDIHRKPGYDPLELFWDRATNAISQNSSLIHGSHGMATPGQAVFVHDGIAGSLSDIIAATEVAGILGTMLG